MYRQFLFQFALAALLYIAPTTARSFRRNANQLHTRRELKSKYLVRTYSVSVDADVPTDPISSPCVTKAISSLVRAWSHANHKNETNVAYSAPSVSEKGGDLTPVTNWTLPTTSDRELYYYYSRCMFYYCFTQCIMSCWYCGGRRLGEENLSFLIGNATLVLDPLIKKQLPVMCPEIQNITAIHIDISDPYTGESMDDFKNLTTWTTLTNSSDTKYNKLNDTKSGNPNGNGK